VDKKEIKKLKKGLKKTLGFKPKNVCYYQKAFIHKSVIFFNKENQQINNERLEFLGDSILDSIISEYLFNKFKNQNEGFLTKTRSKVVNSKKLAEIAKILKILQFIKTQNSSDNLTENICADTFEALIGAIFLDKGFKFTKKFIIKKILTEIIDLNSIIETETNHKSNLIEWAQKEYYSVFFETKEFNLDDKLFVSKLIINKEEFSEGYGKNKKEAEQMAAYKALTKINPNYNNGKKNSD